MILNNKTYNIIKWVVLTALPALSVLVGVLGKAYVWDGTSVTVITINAVAAFLGAATGVSSVTYNRQQNTEDK